MSRWVVRCPEYTGGPYKTQEAAERALQRIEEAGHCRQPHEVAEAES